MLSEIHGGKLQILFQRSILHYKLDDLAAQRIEIICHKLLQLFLEEIGKYSCAGIITVKAQLGLVLGAEEGLADVLAVNLHFVHAVTEEGAACGHKVLESDKTVAAGQILTHQPLTHEADLVCTDMLVGDKAAAWFKEG